MKKLLVILPLLALAGCSLPGSDASLAERETDRQLERLQQQVELLQDENAKLLGDLRGTQEEAGSEVKPESLVCGGPERFGCPDGYTCALQGADADASGTCEAATPDPAKSESEVKTEPRTHAVASTKGEAAITLQDGGEYVPPVKPAEETAKSPTVATTTKPTSSAPEATKPAATTPAAGTNQAAGSLAPRGFSTYSNAAMGISIGYPKFWYYGSTAATTADIVLGFNSSPDFFEGDLKADAMILVEVGVKASAPAATRAEVVTKAVGGKTYRISGPAGSKATLDAMAASIGEATPTE